MDSNVLIIAGATIGGALAGGGIAFGVAIWRERYKENKVKEGLINLLINDVGSLLKLYDELIGENVKQHDEKEIFTSYLVVKQDYFSVFDNNSDRLSYLDDETSKLLIQFYNRAKAHIDTIVRYGKHFEDYRNLPPSIEYMGDIMRREREANYLRTLFKFIRDNHFELEEMALETLLALKKQSKKYKKNYKSG